ncbi:MAG TPA: serine/threonine-protein kinase [Actinomycetes bacterium]|nr:serine/threonine-protein kinase [Actinomycetes bacterium]
MAGPAAERIVARRYVLTAPLGRGGMGVAWRAHDSLLGRDVAVKEVVVPSLLPQAERRAAEARVLREARAAARLNHPGAVTVHDVVREHGHTFIVMELVRAPTLADLIQAKGPLPPERVAEIGVQLAGALEAAHRVGIVHRDVKPANVLVPEIGGVKLADFGVASLQGDPTLTSTGLVLGSPAYMAPEQASGKSSGPPADMWALGATMFFAVEGEPPFDKGALIPTLAAVVNEDPRPMRRAGPIAWVIGALLAKDPAARPSPSTVQRWLRWLVDMARPGPSPATAGGPSGRSHETPTFEPARAASEPAATAAPSERPSRPGPPPARRRGGRRLVGVLALLLAGGLLVVWAVSGIGADSAGHRAARPTVGGGAGATGRAEPAPTTRAGPEATQAPAATVAPQGTLPAGWRAFTNRAGSVRVGVPPGFRARTRPTFHATIVEEERDPGRVFTVRSANPANPLPQASRDYRAWARRNLQDFREVRYAEDQSYAGREGAVVFEYEALRNGRRVHVSHINVKGRTWGYNVEFITPVGRWDSSKELARQFEQAFQPLG